MNFDFVLDAAQIGVTQGWRKYERWVGAGRGDQVLRRTGQQSAPESILQVSVAEALLDHVPTVEFVSLEEGVGKNEHVGWPVDSSRLIDIVGWARDGQPVVLVEVKRGLGSGGTSLERQLATVAELAKEPCVGIGVASKRFKNPDDVLPYFEQLSGFPIARWFTLPLRALVPGGATEPVLGVALYRAVSS